MNGFTTRLKARISIEKPLPGVQLDFINEEISIKDNHFPGGLFSSKGFHISYPLPSNSMVLEI